MDKKQQIKALMDEHIIPAHAPRHTKMSDEQWTEKLMHIVTHTSWYRNSTLKDVLVTHVK